MRLTVEQLRRLILNERIRGHGFDIREFRSLKEHSEILEYADSRLKRIGRGSSRIAFLLTSRRVLKVTRGPEDASFSAGISQNETEVDIFTDPSTKPIATKIYDFSPDYFWVIADLVRPLTSYSEFEILTGVSHQEFYDTITLNGGYWNDDALDYEDGMPKFLESAVKFTNKHNLGRDDVAQLEHWGKTPDGRVVILDYGFTKEINQKYY